MNYSKLARKIRYGYDGLKQDTNHKLFYITWNHRLETSEITIKNDDGFKAVIIGDIRNHPDARGYMYLFYTDNPNKPFLSIKEIEQRLEIVAQKGELNKKDACYFDLPEYGSLELQKQYFAEIINNATT